MPSSPLSDFVSALRKANRWSREDVAERAKRAGHDISQSYIAKIEQGDPKTGRVPALTLAKIDALAAGLAVGRDDIIRALGGLSAGLASSNHAAAMVSAVIKNNESTKTSAFPARPDVKQDITPASERDAEGIPDDERLAALKVALEPVNVYGSASCGEPHGMPSDEPLEILFLPKEMLVGVSFGIRVEGDSMSGYGLNAGETVLIRKTDGERIPSGKPVVLCVDGCYIVKMLRRDDEGEKLEEFYAGKKPERVDLDTGAIYGVVLRSVVTKVW